MFCKHLYDPALLYLLCVLHSNQSSNFWPQYLYDICYVLFMLQFLFTSRPDLGMFNINDSFIWING